MKDYNQNVAIVLNTLRRYQYPAPTLAAQQRCFTELGHFLEAEFCSKFCKDIARHWCETLADRDYAQIALSAVDQLDDIYKYGRILGNNLMIFPTNINEAYKQAIDVYIASFSSAPTDYYLTNKWRFEHFCCFLQFNGISCLEELTYSVLEQYNVYLCESGTTGSNGMLSSFLAFHSHNGRCRIGYSIYMRTVVKASVAHLADLSESAAASIEALRTESLDFPSENFYELLPDFRKRMEAKRYSSKTVCIKIGYLKRFYLFLDMENLGYNYEIIDILLQEKGAELFGNVGCLEARRTLKAFEDYTQVGDIIYQVHRKSPNGYDLLPEWYLKEVDAFVDSKMREKVSFGTVGHLRSNTIRLHRFLLTEGIKSFDEITPAVLKEINRQDIHKTLYAKNIFNEDIKQFLVHLELRGIVPAGIHYAIPKCYAGGETIVEVLTDEDRECIRQYCANAQTPVQIRNAAMIQIAESTGLRPSDIVSLSADNLNFHDQTIRFKQKKTGVEHVAHMNIDTCNAIYRYIKDVRPKNTGDKHIFLSTNAPFRPLKSTNCAQIIKQTGASKATFRILRKTFATELGKGGAKVKDIADGLGHSNADNVHKYLLLDEQRMRLCPLSLNEVDLVMNERY